MIIKERKLERRCSISRLLVQISESGVAGYVKELYWDQVKQYHLDNIKTYYQRAENQNSHTIIYGTEIKRKETRSLVIEKKIR